MSSHTGDPFFVTCFEQAVPRFSTARTLPRPALRIGGCACEASDILTERRKYYDDYNTAHQYHFPTSAKMENERGDLVDL